MTDDARWVVLAGRTSAPPPDTRVPAVIRRVAAGRPIRPVWLNELGALTCEVGDPTGRWFLKWTPPEAGPTAVEEAARMTWLSGFSRVPEVLDVLTDPSSDATVLVTRGLPGEAAVSERWRANPADAVRAIGEGLRYLHQRAPVRTCPFSWQATDRLDIARARVAAGAVSPTDWHPDHQHLRVADALAILSEPPSVDMPVVCHGDSCAPNTIIDDDGLWSGHVDLGRAGVADRWADLAVATWSTTWNYGPGWEQALLEAYGIDPDPVRTAYYRLLWDLT